VREAHARISREQYWKEAVVAASDRERQQLVQRLHDELFPHLLGAAFSFQAVSREFSPEDPRAPEMRRLAKLLNSAVAQSRSIVRSGEPAKFDVYGLHAALQELLKSLLPEVSARVEFQNSGDGLPSNVVWQAYRIAQQAIANVARHARASKVLVRIDLREADFAFLEIIDDGRGFVRADVPARLSGLAMMRFRAEVFGGRLAIHTAIARGTSVLLVMSVRE
jgi:signal transduction histidine kinase